MKIAVAMSGGVDSSTSAAILKEQGHEVTGITMKLWKPESLNTHDHAADAAEVANILGIKHIVIDLSDYFYHEVVTFFASEYYMGRTPNPCVKCNRVIKFGKLLDYAKSIGCDRLATGHYAKTRTDHNGTVHLLAGDSTEKDQSYFLSMLSQKQLSNIIFPLSSYKKPEVREIARRFSLPVSEKSESQDICFIPDNNYAEIIENEFELTPLKGQFITPDGKRSVKHSGIHNFTVGQRKGLGIAWKEPLYVSRIDSLSGDIYLSELSGCFSSELRTCQTNWIIEQRNEFDACCRIRYRHTPSPCRVVIEKDGYARVAFNEPQKGIAPGQLAAFYRGDELLGGGWIE